MKIYIFENTLNKVFEPLVDPLVVESLELINYKLLIISSRLST